MRRLLLLFAAIFSLLSCEKTDTGTSAYLSISKDYSTIYIPTDGDIRTVPIEASGDVTITITNNDSGWVSIVYSASASELTIEVAANGNLEKRSAAVTLECDGLKESFMITQLASEFAILLNVSSIEVPAQGGELTFKVTANVEYEIFISDSWVSDITPKTRALDGGITTEYIYDIYVNADDERTAIINFKQTDNGACTNQLSVLQKSTSSYSNTFDPSEILEDVKVDVLRAEVDNYQSGSGADLTIDGIIGENTYHSSWSNTVFPITLDYYFEEKDIDYLVYYPRPDGGNGCFGEVDIYIATVDNPTLTLYAERDFNKSSSASLVTLGGQEGVTQVTFSIKSGSNDFASCSEMEFYTYNTENYDPYVLFSNTICTELHDYVTLEDIENCPSEFYKTIAIHMYTGNYEDEFRIQSFKAWKNPDIESTERRTSTYSLNDNPTGIYTTAGEQFVVIVGDEIGDTSVSLKGFDLYCTDYDGYYQSETFALTKGVNLFTPTLNGLLYVMYHSDSPESLPEIPIHFPTGGVNGYYDSSKHTSSDWYRLISAAKHRHFDMVGEFAHLTFPTTSFLSFASGDGPDLLAFFDDIVEMEQNFMGIGDYSGAYLPYFSNRMYLHVMYQDDAYMYATGNRTAYHNSTLEDILTLSNLKTDGIWGPAHEIGHVNQTRPLFRWAGTTEVTNNVMSLLIQTELGTNNTSRLISDGCYTAAHEVNSAGDVAFCEYDIWYQLVAFWQLYLYNTKALGNDDFYPDIYEQCRNLDYTDGDNGAHLLNFYKMACDAAQLDFTEFFEYWGYFEVISKSIEDYGTGTMTVTSSMVSAAKSYVSTKGYSKPSTTKNIYEITDQNWEGYK